MREDYVDESDFQFGVCSCCEEQTFVVEMEEDEFKCEDCLAYEAEERMHDKRLRRAEDGYRDA